MNCEFTDWNAALLEARTEADRTGEVRWLHIQNNKFCVSKALLGVLVSNALCVTPEAACTALLKAKAEVDATGESRWLTIQDGAICTSKSSPGVVLPPDVIRVGPRCIFTRLIFDANPSPEVKTATACRLLKVTIDRHSCVITADGTACSIMLELSGSELRVFRLNETGEPDDGEGPIAYL